MIRRALATKYTAGGARLTTEAQQAIADFTTMWDFFEGNRCRNEGNIAAFDRVVDLYRPNPKNTKRFWPA